MLTISGYTSKSVLTIGFGCRRFGNFCKAGRWCRCYISSRRPSAYSCTRIAALTGAHKHTRQRRRRRRRSTVFTRRVSFGKASHQGLEIWAKGFPTLVRTWSWEERECSNSKDGSRQRFESDIGEMAKGNAMLSLNLWWCIRLKTVMTTDWGAGQDSGRKCGCFGNWNG